MLPPWVVSKTTSMHQTSLTAVAFTFASGRTGTLGRLAGPLMPRPWSRRIRCTVRRLQLRPCRRSISSTKTRSIKTGRKSRNQKIASSKAGPGVVGRYRYRPACEPCGYQHGNPSCATSKPRASGNQPPYGFGRIYYLLRLARYSKR